MFLKQSTTASIYLGPFVDDTDGKTAETGLTPAVYLSKAGAAAVARNSATAISHDRDGYYRVELNATDTGTLGPLRVFSSTAGALPVWAGYTVLPANVYDSLIAGSDALQVHANEITAGLINAAALAADAAAEIADAIWDEATGGHTTAGSAGKALIDANNGTPPTAAAVADAVWDESQTGHTTAGTFGRYLDAQVSAVTAPTTGQIAGAVWDETLAGHLVIGSAGYALNNAGGTGTDPWNTALPGAYANGTAGWLIGQRLDAKVSSVAGAGTPGAGAAEFTYSLTDAQTGLPIADADVWATLDTAGTIILASGRTNQAGAITFYLDPGPVYLWRQKSGYNFVNPDVESVA